MLKKINNQPVAKAVCMFLLLTAILGMLCFSKSSHAQINFINALPPMLIVSGAVFFYTAWSAADMLLAFSLTSLNAVGVAFQCMLAKNFDDIKGDVVTYPILFAGVIILLISSWGFLREREIVRKVISRLCSPPGLLIITGAIAASTLLLLAVSRGHDNKSWLYIGGIQLQLTEFFKVLVVLFFAVLCRTDLEDLRFRLLRSRFFWAEAVIVITIGCFGVLGEMGSVLLISMLAVGMTFLTFEKKRYGVFMLLSIAGLLLVGYVLLQTIGSAYANAVANGQQPGGLFERIALANARFDERVALWRNGIDDPELQHISLQLKQARAAAIKGGLTGTINQVYVPVEESDYAFIGLLARGGVVVGGSAMILFFVILRQGLIAASELTDKASAAITSGMAMIISFGFAINACSASGLIPLAGLPAPFISRGGTAQLINYFAAALMLYFSGNRNSLVRSVVNAFRDPISEQTTKAEKKIITR